LDGAGISGHRTSGVIVVQSRPFSAPLEIREATGVSISTPPITTPHLPMLIMDFFFFLV